jgi:hypothetical protein
MTVLDVEIAKSLSFQPLIESLCSLDTEIDLGQVL